MVLSFDGVTLLTQSTNLWCHLAWRLNKAGPACGCRTAGGTVGVRQPWALQGTLQSGGPSATVQHPEFL